MNINSIAIEITKNAFLPEAYAYRKLFISKGYRCDFVDKGSPDILSYDVVVLFHGIHPFWKKYPKIIIGEYHTLSTGRCSRLKDIIKRVINVRPNFYVFLNDVVREKMWFSSRVPHIKRQMGFDSEIFKKYQSELKKYDVVYAGSFRYGIVEKIEFLANLGLKVAVVGFEYDFSNHNVIVFGRKKPDETYKIISQSKVGLNFTPDVFPFNIQDSTKVIEYCGAGIGVITNSYQWIDDFSNERKAHFLSLDTIINKSDVLDFNYIIPNVDDLAWVNLSNLLYDKLSDIDCLK